MGTSSQCFSSHPDIALIIIGGDKFRFHITDFSDCSLLYFFSDCSNVWAVQIRKRFHQIHMIFFCCGKQFFRLCLCRCQWLFTKHVFSTFQCSDRPLIMQSIWKGNVHCFHFRIRKQFLIASVSFLKMILFFKLLRFFHISSGNCIQLTIVCLLHSGNGTSCTNVGCSHNAPSDFSHDFSHDFSSVN